MTDKPSEAAIREACRRAGYTQEADICVMIKHTRNNAPIILAASLIEKFEPETLIDPVTRRAREIVAEEWRRHGSDALAQDTLDGVMDKHYTVLAVIRALKEGMPK